MGKEKIICAANYYNDGKEYPHNPINITIGFVVCGRRHHNCIQTFTQIVGFPYTEQGHKINNTEVQGFMTSKNRFVDRKEALIIALESNQVIDKSQIRNDNLYSEDLY